jgi:hypothetical protein
MTLMKRFKLLLLTILIPVLSFSQSKSCIGPTLSYIHYPSFKLGNWTPGLQFDAYRDRFIFRLTANIGIPQTINQNFDLYNKDSLAYTQSANYAQGITGKETYSGISLYLDVNYFLRGDGEFGGFYLTGGLGFNLLQVKHTFDEFDDQLYYSELNDRGRTNYFYPIMRLGVGYDVNLSFGNVYLQGYINIPASTSQSNVSGSPFSLGSTIGLRLPFRTSE